MNFAVGMKDRIQKLVGPKLLSEEDFSFLQPGGNDHLIQFLYKNYSDEYRELDNWDRYNLLLADISTSLDIDFNLDEDARFAWLEKKNSKGIKTIQAVMDLRDDYLVVVYYFGDSNACIKLNQKLCLADDFHPCFINSDQLIDIAKNIGKISSVQYNFEQLPSMFLQPVVMKGVIKGKLADEMCLEYAERYMNFFNVDAIAGIMTEGIQGAINFLNNGNIRVDACRLSSFLEIANSLFLMLRAKYKNLLENYIVKWEEISRGSLLRLRGNPVVMQLQIPIDKMDGLIKLLTQGNKPLQLIGTSARKSRKMWSVKVTELNSARQLEFDLSDRIIRVLLKNRNAIPLLDKTENFFRQHVGAELDSVAW